MSIKNLFKSSLIYSIGNVLNQVVSLLMLPFFTSYLTPEDYGLIAILGLITTILVPIFSMGFGVSVGYCYYEQSDIPNKNKVIWNAFFCLTLSSFVSLLIGFTFLDYFNTLLFNGNNYSNLITMTLVSSFLTIPSTVLTSKLMFEDKPMTVTFISLLSTIITLYLNILLIVDFSLGVFGRVLANLLATEFSFLLYFVFCVKGITFKIDLIIIKSLIKLGLPMVLPFISLYVLQNGNIYILKSVSSVSEVGLYSIANTFGSSIGLFINAFFSSWFPFAMSLKDKKEEASLIFGRVISYYVYIFGLLSLILYACSELIIFIFTNKNFYDSYKVIGIISTAQVIMGFSSIINIETYISKDTKYLGIIQVFSSILFIPIAYLLSYKFGAFGAGFSLALAYLILSSMLLYWNKINSSKYINIKYKKKELFMFISMYIFSCIFILSSDYTSLITKILSNLIILSIFTSLVYFFILDKEDKNRLTKKLLKNKPLY